MAELGRDKVKDKLIIENQERETWRIYRRILDRGF